MATEGEYQEKLVDIDSLMERQQLPTSSSYATRSITDASQNHSKEPSHAEAPSEGESVGPPDFDQLLQMLRVEHESEVSSLKRALEFQLQETEQELQEARSRLQLLQLELPTEHAEVEHKAEPADKASQEVEVIPTAPPQANAVETNGREEGKHHKFGHHFHKKSRSAHSDVSQPQGETLNLSKDQANELALIKGWVSHPASKSRTSGVFDKNDAAWRRRVKEVVSTTWFEVICAIAILSNSLVMGVQIDHSTRYDEDPGKPPRFFRVMDRLYLVWFVFELLLKMVAFGCSFWCRPGAAWNIFDFLIVTTDVLQTVLEIIFHENGQRANFTFLRMLRMMRVTRAIKVVRLVRFFRELRIMVASVMKCGTSLMWSLLMFISIIYLFALVLLNSVAFYIHANPDDEYRTHFREYWKSVPQGMWTLFSCMTGGVSWMEVGSPLVHMGWVYGAIIGFYMYFTLFVVTNIITGIFVDTAIQNAQSDRDEVIQEELHSRDSARRQLKEIFECADSDESGSLSIEEFEEHLCDERVKAHLKSIGIQVAEAHGLFRLLDMDGNNNIKIEEFLFGCMRLKGGASSIDLATLMYENKRLNESFKRFRMDVIALLNHMSAKLDGKAHQEFNGQLEFSI